MDYIKTNFLVTLVFDENTDIRKQVDTELAFKDRLIEDLQRLIIGKEIKHFVVADDEVINDKLKKERKVGKWIYDKTSQNWRCSVCNETPKTLGFVGTSEFMTEHFKFCNHCGAEMRGAENG